MRNNYKKGFTMTELIVVFAIIAILTAVVLPQFSSIKENQAIKDAASDTVSAINKARSETLASLSSSEYGVYFRSNPNQIIIFKGMDYASSASKETIDLTSPAFFSAGALAVPSEFYFNRLSGTPSFAGSKTIIVSTPHFTKTITISATGIVSMN